MKPRFLLLASTLASFAAAQDPAPKPPEPQKPKVLTVGDTLPKGLSLRALDGKVHTLDSLRGKVVVMHFWSTTCPYEVAAEPKLNALADEFRAKDVVVLGIAGNAEEIGPVPDPKEFEHEDASKRPYAAARKKAAESKVNHTILVDHGGDTLGKLLDAKTTPHCFVFDKEGKLRYQGALDDDPQGKKQEQTFRYVHSAVTALLADEAPPVTTTKPYG